MWHKSKEPPCLFTHTVDTCYYIPTTCLYLTSRRIVCGQLVPFRTSSSQVVRTGSQWQRKHLPTVPEYKYLPNKPVVGTVWQPLTWLSVQLHIYSCTGKQTTQLSTQTQCVDAAWPHSVPNIMSQAPCYFTFHQDCTLLFHIPPRVHRVTLHSIKTASCYFTFHQECALLLYIQPRMHPVISHSTKTAPCYFTFHQECKVLLYIPSRLHPVTKTAPCYFTFHQECTLLLYVQPIMHLVILHSTKTAPCYFTFHQDCTLLLYIPPRLHLVTLYIPPRLHLVTIYTTKTVPCYFTLHQDWTFSQVLLPKRTSNYQSQWRQNRPA
jgi:hypothetical protein